MTDSEHYRSLRQRLVQLQAAPIPDQKAIDAVIDALSAEQLRLKGADGQHGNNPVEPSREHPRGR